MSKQPDIQEIRLPIEGMECAACAVRLERQLSKRESVSSASVNYATAEACVVIDPSAVTLADLTTIVEKSGFQVGDMSDAEAHLLEDGYPRARRRFLFAAILTLPVLVLSMLPGLIQIAGREWVLLVLSAPVVLFAGAPFFIDAARVLRAGSANMNTLISLGVGASFTYSLVATIAPDLVTGGDGGAAHVYYEAAAVITTLVLLGRMLEARAKDRTNAAVRELIELQPDTAIVLTGDGEVETPISAVSVGDRILLRPGTRVPVDGIVDEGESDIDESMLTGEPMPVQKIEGTIVSAGTMNLTGSVVFRATRVGADTALHRIIELVRAAQGKKPPIQRLADQVSAVFVPSILVISVITFAVWMFFGPSHPLRFALVAAVSVLIIACPCALGLATPTAVLVGLGRAAGRGIFIKGGGALERLNKIDAVVLDKTGTLTEGAPEVVSVFPASIDEESLLSIAAGLERHSEHPIARAICEYSESRGITARQSERFLAHVGGGVTGRMGGSDIQIGSADFVRSSGDGSLSNSVLREDGQLTPGSSAIYIVIDGSLGGTIHVADRIRSTSREAVERLHEMKIQVVMASGDQPETARHIGSQVGVDDVRAGLSPEDKVAVVQQLRASGRTVAVVGDGINDAPALAAADVGIAIGTGTDIALETADVGLIRNDVRSVAEAISISRMTMKVIRENLFFAFFYNVVGIPIAAGILYPVIGLLLNPMIASAAMAMSSVSVVTNSLRLRKKSR